jgi:hypothetical protein
MTFRRFVFIYPQAPKSSHQHIFFLFLNFLGGQYRLNSVKEKNQSFSRIVKFCLIVIRSRHPSWLKKALVHQWALLHVYDWQIVSLLFFPLLSIVKICAFIWFIWIDFALHRVCQWNSGASNIRFKFERILLFNVLLRTAVKATFCLSFSLTFFVWHRGWQFGNSYLIL